MQAQPAPTPGPEQRTECRDARHHRGVLNDLIDMGHAIACRIHAGAMAAKPGEEDPTIPFDRIARTVRRTIALVRTLDEPHRPARAAARRRILRTVEDVIARADPGLDRGALQSELHERLDAPELAETLDDDIDQGRPVPEIIAEICHDLGLASPGFPPHRRRTPADIVALIARAASSRPAGGPGPARQREAPPHPRKTTASTEGPGHTVITPS